MAQCAVRLRNYPPKTVKSGGGKAITLLTSDFGPMLGLDVSDAIVQITDCEIKQQERIGNDPTNLIINNGRGPQNIRTSLELVSRSKPGALVFKTQTFFGRAQEMIDAARDAYILLRSLTRIRSGIAVQNYMFYVGKRGDDNPGRMIGKGFTGFNMLKGIPLDEDSTISIVGPLTAYGRRLYWNPKGGKTVAKRFPGTREASRKLGISIRGGFIGTETIHTDVKKRMRRKAKFKAFSIGDPFYLINAALIWGFAKDINTMKRPLRMPAITIQMKKQGRIR